MLQNACKSILSSQAYFNLFLQCLSVIFISGHLSTDLKLSIKCMPTNDSELSENYEFCLLYVINTE